MSIFQQKAEIELQLGQLFDELRNLNVDMDTSLLTTDGFPRSDIDVVRVCSVRTRIIRLRNDLKGVMSIIASQLHSSLPTHDSEREETCIQDSDIPFAQIVKVIPTSPAAEAKLLVGDKLVMFDRINVSNHGNLKELARVVQLKEDRPISVKIQRDGDFQTISLVPHSRWNGKGLLGCQINLL